MKRTSINLFKLIIPVFVIALYIFTLYRTAVDSLESEPARKVVLPPISFEGSLPVDLSIENMHTEEYAQFQPLDEPHFIPSSRATWLKPEALILGVEQNNAAVAFPVFQMAYHHIANVIIGGAPFLVTYCVVCSSAVGFDPVVDGIRYTFEPFGLYRGMLVMRDRQVGELWTNYDGRVIIGDSKQIKVLPVIQMTWAEWQMLHPETQVLDWYSEFARDYREVIAGNSELDQIAPDPALIKDKRLSDQEMVLGISVQSGLRAYVLSDFGKDLTILNDTLGDAHVLVVIDNGIGYAAAFRSEYDDQTLEFSFDKDQIQDRSGTHWNLAGKAIDGPLMGSQLAFVQSFITEWYGWSSIHPDSSIYGH